MLTFSSYLNMRIQLLRDIILLLAFLSVLSASGEDPGPLHLEKEIPLPGVEGRIDHFSADFAGQRLFIAALENGSKNRRAFTMNRKLTNFMLRPEEMESFECTKGKR